MYVSRVKGSNPGENVVLSPTPQCSSYWKRSLQVTHDYCHQLHFYLVAYNDSEQSLFYLAVIKILFKYGKKNLVD